MTDLGFPQYRASQVLTWLYKSRVSSFSKMSNLPKELIELLDREFLIDSISGYKKQQSSDGTIKFLFDLQKGSKIESVLIPEENRLTLCVSSQAGCALGCAFCATGKLGLDRNLTTSEIIDQVLKTEEITGSKISNIVFMGMGEPLQNYSNVMKAINTLSEPKYGIISLKKITISTSGIVPKILQLADEPKPVRLALSLHATTDGMRQKIMPVALKWKVSELRDALRYYYEKTGLPITFEYIVFEGFNDDAASAGRLARFVRSFPSKVNLIPYHNISFVQGSSDAIKLKTASNEKIIIFANELRKLKVNVFIRKSSGADIDAACGQLAFSDKIMENTV
jgi:23S rRNA (adenine2503-C2)-methyltransferase